MVDVPVAPAADHTESTAMPNRGARWARIVTAVGGLGAGLVGGGVLLALYSRFGASSRTLDDRYVDGRDVFGGFRLPLGDVPGHWITAALIAGVIMLIVVGDLLRRSRDPEGGVSVWWLLMVVVLFGLGWYSVTRHIPGVLDEVRFQYPFFPQLPTAAAAIGLVLLGTIGVFGLVRTTVVHTAGRKALLLGLTVGVVMSAVTAAVAVHAGDDNARIDHATATPVPVPAIPAHLGSERYRVTPVNPAGDRDYPDIVAAGAGFVVATITGLIAYDGVTGAERWHFQRSDVLRDRREGVGYIIGSLRALDEGTVVLAQWKNGDATAFDAVTGALLWTRSEFTDVAFSGAQWRMARESEWTGATPLLAENGSRLDRFDARTGNRLWSKDFDCPMGFDRTISTTAAIYVTSTCPGTDEAGRRLVVTALSPATGAVIAEREVARLPAHGVIPPHYTHLGGALIIGFTQNDSEDDHWILIDRPENLSTARIRPGYPWNVFAADATGAELLVQLSKPPGAPDTVEVRRSADDSVAYRIEIPGRGTPLSKQVDLFLADELVEATYYSNDTAVHPRTAHAWSRIDGTPITATPISRGDEECDPVHVLSGPGSTLVLCYAATGTDIIGFAP
ncbi:PQQ-binding-like beta-propeller repeat protein [Nocardia sp. NPDC056100]|uniref:outer membrane protein assembly factor BamB family protein n=1 Tax=Nocardia sp. NPDC056100 TaxID=3345712 RepID=UPI0035DA6D15